MMRKRNYVVPSIEILMGMPVGPNGYSGNDPHGDAEQQGGSPAKENRSWENMWEDFED